MQRLDAWAGSMIADDGTPFVATHVLLVATHASGHATDPRSGVWSDARGHARDPDPARDERAEYTVMRP